MTNTLGKNLKILNNPIDISLGITSVKINSYKKMGHQFLGVLKTCFWKPVILFTQHFVDYFLGGIEAKIEPFCSNNHDIHCRFGTNASKITHLSLFLFLSLSQGSWPTVSLFCFMLSRMTGDDGPAMLMGIDLFQKGINSDFQGLRNDFNFKEKKMISHFSEFRDGWKNRNEENQGKNS